MFEISIYDEFHKLMEQIPDGMVSTYGDIAYALGDIVASRAVGVMLSENKNPQRYPCHRIVNSDGSIGGFTHPLGIEEKIRRLRNEGVNVSNGKIENFDKIRFREFKTDYPLLKFRNWAKSLEIEYTDNQPECLRALDITYQGDLGIGVGVTFNDNIEYDFLIERVNSPYIPNYLYLREGKIFSKLVDKDCLNIIDGNGILHRDNRGLATLVGIVKKVSTVGMAKSLLTGLIIGDKVYMQNMEVGRVKGKYVISPGNRVNWHNAYRLISESKFFPHTKYPDRLGRKHRDEILHIGNSL